jgi:SAM-dependent methyltransferase
MLEPTRAASPSPFSFELIERVCPGCRSADSRPFAAANVDAEALNSFAFASRKPPEYMHYALRVCRVCDLLYASPCPRREALEAAYHDAAFDASDESHFAALTYGGFLPQIGAQLTDRRGALDIGTGDGAFLQQLLDHGFSDVVGVEPSAAPTRAAHPRVASLIRHAPFRATDFAQGSLQLVTCFQTIEHVYDPLALCRETFELLRPGGALFIVCHNRRAFSARAMGFKSPIFDVEHLQLFSPRSMEALLTRAGFSRVELHRIVNRYPLNYLARLFPLPGRVKPHALKLLRESGVGRVMLSAPVGNLAAIAHR